MTQLRELTEDNTWNPNSAGNYKMNHLMTNPTKWPVCPAKTQISPGCSESLLGTHAILLVLLCCGSNNQKKDPLEIQHPKFENNRLSFVESVHER